jgi:hypothetical protein
VSCAYHHYGIYLTYPNGAQTITTLNVYDNIWDGQAQGVNGGTATYNCATSQFFMDGNDNITAGYFYNNVVMSTTACTTTGGGDPLINWGINGGTIYVYNNTFVCAATNDPPGGMEMDEHSGSTTANFFNNLIVNCGRNINMAAVPGAYSPPTTGFDYNVYAQMNNGNMWNYHGCCQNPFSAWQSAIQGAVVSSESHSTYTSGSPGLGGSFENGSQSPISGIVPQSGSVALNCCENLTALGITNLNSDITGSARPSTGAWSAGALNFGSGGSQASAPSCTPTSGNVPQTVTCTNPNSGTTVMCYTTNGTTPATNGSGTGCTTGTQYTTPVVVSSPATLEVIAGTSTLTDSTVSSYTYTAGGGGTSTSLSGITARGVVIQ